LHFIETEKGKLPEATELKTTEPFGERFCANLGEKKTAHYFVNLRCFPAAFPG